MLVSRLLARAARCSSQAHLTTSAPTPAPPSQTGQPGKAALDKSTPIGVLGVGNVGNAVARNLLRTGYNVSVMYDESPKAGSDLENTLERTSSPRELAEKCDFIVSALPKPDNLRAAFEGDDGLLAGIRSGTVWVDHSTTDYQITKRCASELERRGATMIEAPITGGLEALKKGQMVVYLAGDKPTCDLIRPILEVSYKRQIYLGPLGTAQMAKLISNMLCMVNVAAMTEAMVLARRMDVDLRVFWDAIRAGAGNSFAWETAGPLVFNGKYDPGFTSELICKDLHLGYCMARDHYVPLPVNGLVQQLCQQALAKHGPEAGCYIVPKLLEEACGTPLQTDGFDNWSYTNQIIEGSMLPKHTF